MNKPLKTIGLIALILISIYVIANMAGSGHGRQLVKEYDFTQEELTITVTFHNSTQGIREAWEKHNSEFDFDPTHVSAFANLFPSLKRCDIHTLRIRGQNDRIRKQTLGHEMLHCIHGRWHPGNETLSNMD